MRLAELRIATREAVLNAEPTDSWAYVSLTPERSVSGFPVRLPRRAAHATVVVPNVAMGSAAKT